MRSLRSPKENIYSVKTNNSLIILLKYILKENTELIYMNLILKLSNNSPKINAQ